MSNSNQDRVSVNGIEGTAALSLKELAVLAFRNSLRKRFSDLRAARRAFPESDPRAVENWWHGRNRAGSEVIMYFLGLFPDAAPELSIVTDAPPALEPRPARLAIAADAPGLKVDADFIARRNVRRLSHVRAVSSRF